MNYNVSFDVEFRKHSYPGKFIVIEGIDGSGKTTQVAKVVESLKSQGKDVVITKEPTDGEVGQLIRKMLSGKVEFTPVAFQYLFAADRVMHMEEVENLLKGGKIVVSDRYFWSAIAYGLADKKGMDFENSKEVSLVAQSILSMYHQFLLPDYTFYLKIPVDVSLSRLGKMDKEKEVYEKKENLEKVYVGYEWLAEKFPDEIMVIEGTQDVKDITQNIVACIQY